jgi:putative PIN family toxin of toxin-antitoxin system
VKAVLDTNVLLSAFTKPSGRLGALWNAAEKRRFQLLISPAIVAEVAEKLREKFHWEESRILRQSKLMAKTGRRIVVPRFVLDVIPDDPDDNRILECAVEGNADLIVSGDRTLLRLKSYRGIPIVRPIDFHRTLGLD